MGLVSGGEDGHVLFVSENYSHLLGAVDSLVLVARVRGYGSDNDLFFLADEALVDVVQVESSFVNLEECKSSLVCRVDMV